MANSAFTAVRSVTGTSIQIDSTGGTTPVISIDPAYPGQTSFTELGTVVIGEWEATPVGLQWGGTNGVLTASNGGIFYSTATAGAILAGTATANRIILSGSSSAPAWSTATYPATTTVSQILYSSSANVIAGLATANNGVLLTNGSGVPSIGTATIAVGGTGASTAATALSNLGALPIAGGTMTGFLILNADPTNALGAVTKQYADAISAGLDIKAPCYAGTTATLNATYLNGVAGIGATLINAGSLAAFSVDGTTPAINSRILVKNQSSTFQNGIYTLSTVGSGAVAWILTRATDYDSAAEIFPGNFILVDNGTANANTAWIQIDTVTTIGTDPIAFTQFGNTGTVTSVSGTALQIDVANGTSTPVISINAGYLGQTSITTLGTVATGTWSATNIALNKGGTNAALTASNGGIFYSTASAGAILSGTATANQVLLSGSSTTPAWSTATFPATTTINQLLYSSSANIIVGLSTGNSGVLITSSGGVPSISSTLPSAVQGNITATGTIASGTWNGSIITGTYGGTGINNGANTITIGGNISTAGALTLSGAFGATFTFTNTTSVTFPTSGTLATTAGIPSLPLSLSNGGTNASLTASNGGIFYSTASAGAILSGTATANQVLLSGSSTTPAWSTATYPATTTVSQLLYSSSANVVAGLATANNGVLLTNGSGVPSIGTATVAVGGTGNTTFTAYSVICAGTTATGAFQNVSGVGTSGQVLTSNGASALPTWQASGGGGAGTVLQCLSTTITARSTTTSTSFVDISGLTQAITPSSSSNKILIMVTLSAGAQSTDYQVFFNIVRGSTSICLGDASSPRTQCTTGAHGSASNDAMVGISMSFLDSPSTTSSTTYKIQMAAQSPSTLAINGTVNNGSNSATPLGTSTITLMEIKG